MVLRIIDYLDNCNLLDFIREKEAEEAYRGGQWEEGYVRQGG
jgi:hypothetical protein